VKAAAALVSAVLVAIVGVGASSPSSTAFAVSNQRVDVQLTASGPWIARLIDFDLTSVQSVTYYVRDASRSWRSTAAVVAEPFEAAIDWWDGDNSGYEVVTAHVTLRSGRMLKDPGGWHWVSGQHASPRGSIEAWTNTDGSPGASYRPDSHVDDIQQVEFWFRDQSNAWHDVGSGAKADEDADWLLQAFKGVGPGWQGPQNAVSVHVIWPNGRQLVDPTDWATSMGASSISAKAMATESLACGDPHSHVYSPNRLKLLSACVTVTGVIDAIRIEKDGDLHILLRLDPGQAKYINVKNAAENGDLVLEPVCVRAPTQSDAVAACAGFRNRLRMPAVGAHVFATGAWVLDQDHGWLEIHPLFAFGAARAPAPSPTAVAAQPSPTQSPTAAPPPAAPPVAPPPPPPADPYAALRAQGISAICKDGTYSYSKTRSGTCSHHGGVAVWTGLI
jgi:hypothetical protein